MPTITIQNRIDCYRYGKELFYNNISRKEAVGVLVKSGMNERSAVYYLQCVVGMLSGKRYTATINESSTSYFLTCILSDFGMSGLSTALQSMRAHLDYQKGKNELPGLEKLYQDFLEVLP